MASLPQDFTPSNIPPTDDEISSEPFWLTADPGTPPAPARSRFVECRLEDGQLVIDNIPDGYTEEEKELIAYWYPEHYNQPSPYVEAAHGKVLTGEQALEHARGVNKEQTKASRQTKKQQTVEEQNVKQETKERNNEAHARFAEAHRAWIEQCGQRKQHIAAQNEEWKLRILKRKEAMVNWDMYVQQAREELHKAKSTPIPRRPQASDFE